MGMVREAGPADPCDSRVLLKPAGDGLGVGSVSFDADRQGLEPLQEQKGVERRKGRPAVA